MTAPVHLVGAGPGDPGLLTVRGAEVLRQAEVVVHDRLVAPAMLDLAPEAALRVDVGKSPGGPVDQAHINAVLVEHARAGRRVVRLKGGDPFVFGRGGEEAEALRAAGVAFVVVPGVTSAVAVPAYAGIPVTHRGLSTSFTVVTGHSRHAADRETNWEALAAAGGTIVVLMGVAHRAAIAARLQAGGLAPSTPVAAVHWGTRPDQRTVRTTLAGLAAAHVETPATIVIGEVAGLDLGWFETRPLFGRTVVVTRARGQASSLSDLLRAEGADVVEIPTIAIVDPADGGAALAAAASRVAAYEWVVFTSANAVDRLFAHIPDTRALGSARVAAVGPATAAALRRYRVDPDLVPARYVAEGILEAFPEGSGDVLLPRAAEARDILPATLTERGRRVDVVEAYRTVPVPISPADLVAVGGADAVTFTSSSGVSNFVAAGGAAAVPPVVACIGEVTAATARDLGLSVALVASASTLEALVAALGRRLGG